MNKKGYSLGGWIEGILLVILVVGMISIINGGFNYEYGNSNQFDLVGNDTQDNFISYQSTLDREIQGGEVDFDSNSGLTLRSSWNIIKGALGIIWDFITGGWIEKICNYMNLPTQVATTFRLLYFLSLGFIVLYILFKVKV